MDALRQTFQQYAGLFRSMSPGQRGTLIAVPLVIATALTFLMFHDRSSGFVALSWGKVFTTEELMSAEQTLIDAGLTEFRRDGQRLMVPSEEIERYNAALLAGGSLPSNYAEELERQLDKQSVFTSERQAKAYRDLALKKELRRIIRAIPDVEDADVVWARGESGRWPNRGGKVTATVSVRLRRGQELSSAMVQSLRTAVASMVPDLKTADVVVLDLNSGSSHVPNRDGDRLDNGLIARIREFTHAYEQKIRDALSYIPGALVTVNVDLENLRSHVERGQKLNPKERFGLEPGADSNRPRELALAAVQEPAKQRTEAGAEGVTPAALSVADREFIAVMPRAVQVSVRIPDDYYQAVALKRGVQKGRTDAEKANFRRAIDAIRAEEERKARATASVLIPAGSPETAVAVSSFVPLDRVELEPDTSVVESAGGAVGQWGSATGLALFALWALWMLNKSTPKRQQAAVPAAPSAAQTPDEPLPDNTKCEPLQTRAGDNPETAAAVLTSKAGDSRQSASPVPFGFLRKLGAENLATLILDEHPQTIALVLSHLHPNLATAVLGDLPSGKQTEVIRRMDRLEQTDPEVVRDVEATLEKRLASTFNENAAANRRTNSGILETLESDDGELVNEVRRLMFVFRDLLKLDDRAIQALLNEVDSSHWAVALKGAPEEIKRKVLGALAPRAAELLEEEMEYLGPVRIRDIEAMQHQIVDAVRRLDDAGEIEITAGSAREQYIT